MRHLLLAIPVAVFAAGCGGPRAASQRPTTAATSTPAALATATPAQIAARSTPSVVAIRSARSMGTGFIVRHDGLIITNLHVLVGGGTTLRVFLSDKREFPVLEIVTASPEHDLALVRIDATDLPVLPLGDSDAVQPGEAVVAIGHPLGLEHTVSNGLLSAVRTNGDFHVLQISAPLSPGSSGGPVFNDRGQVIGVATAIARGGENLGFGIPVNYVKDLMTEKLHPIALEDTVIPQARTGVSLPAIRRDVPKHPQSILDRCSDAALASVVNGIGEAIEVGAPLYNDGNVAGCYHIYDGAAADLERRLPAACSGPKRALSSGRKKAAALDSPSAQAWAMRDAFDGLLSVIERRPSARSARPAK
jgi:serine protease Do